MRRLYLLASVATLAVAAPLFAQPAPVLQTIPAPTPDADALAGAMRRLAENPRDVDALLSAGELSLKLGDASGAASLFKRAEQVDPANGRVKAGMASILVRSERPGEALRYFSQAEGFGLDPRRFASDRGLAYDLIGEQDRAQRDYRLVLKSDPDDETIRRYALSLGISGKESEALEQIDTLLRKSDRGAWRARAFILAMNGDTAGATKIATSMIPGMARALAPFFTRLAALGPADRAFAVHFGEVGPTPERVADARLTPALAPLPPEARPAPVLAAVTLPTLKADTRKQRRERRRRGSIDRVEVASAAIGGAKPPPPGFGGAGASPTDPIRSTRSASERAAGTLASATRADRRARPDTMPIQRSAPLPFASRMLPPAPARAEVRRSTPPVATPSPQPSALAATKPVEVASVPPPSAVSLPPAPMTGAASPSSASMSTAIVPAPSPAAQGAVAAVRTATIEPPAPTAPAPQAVAPPAPLPTASATRSATPVSPRMSEDSILAKIIAGITIPGYELGVGPPPTPPPTEVVSAIAITPTPAAGSGSVESTALEKRRTEEMAAKRLADERAEAARKADQDRAALAEKKRADAKALAAKKAADAKALAAKKAAEDKALAAKEAAEAKKAARADPPRIWVQVSGGAYQGDLPKAWAAVKARASALSGRQGYSTPLRATNRVVTGPFKTNEEAQAFVNALGKQGVSAFTFTSNAGQKVTRLPAK